MSEQRIAEMFDAWWAESFPQAPCNKQARSNFIAFGMRVEQSLWESMYPKDDQAA